MLNSLYGSHILMMHRLHCSNFFVERKVFLSEAVNARVFLSEAVNAREQKANHFPKNTL